MVLFHKSNKILYDCLVIASMFEYSIIPLTFTNLNCFKKYKVLRSDNTIQDCYIKENNSIVFNNNNNNNKYNYLINVSFYKNKDIASKIQINNDIDTQYYGDAVKNLYIKDFLNINNIDILEINLPYLNVTTENIIEKYPHINDSKKEILVEVCDFYDRKLDILKENISKNMKDLNINITI